MNLREKMLAMLETTHIEEEYAVQGDFLIHISLALMKKANVYLWAEKNLQAYVRLFKSYDLNVKKIVFSRKASNPLDDVEFILPQNLLNDHTPNKFFFMDSSSYSKDTLPPLWEEALKKLSPVGVFTLNDDCNKALINMGPFDAYKLGYYQAKRYRKEIMELFDSLADETSKQTLYYYVESFITNSIYKGNHIPTLWKYFFGGKYEKLYKHLDDECWINCGAYVGDTIFAYFSHDLKPKKIYAFEGNVRTYKILLKNLSLLPPDKRELVEPIHDLITDKTDFEKVLSGNKCTLLNADIEGSELSLLQSMKNVIQKDRPVIAICVYHRREDLLNIPQFLQSICKDYVYYLRKYTSHYVSLKRVGEMVLYAIPIERSTLIPPLIINLRILIFDCLVRDKKSSNGIIAARNLAA